MRPASTADRAASPVSSPADWNAALASLPGAHLLQSWEWGSFKGRYGWSPRRLLWTGAQGQPVAAAQVLTRSLPGLRLRVMYVPRGPLLDWADPALRDRILASLESLARSERAVFVKIDPEAGAASPGPPPSGQVTAGLAARGWRFSPDQVQFRNTVTLDLQPPEAGLLARMKPKTRYNIRLAEKKGVRVRTASRADLDLLYRMYAETSLRDGFVIRPPDYYAEAWGSFMAAGLAEALIAEAGGEPVSGLVMFCFAGTAWYMYGMSRAVHRDKMPNHLLQWEAIRRAKERGCTTYDFWGAPDRFDEADPMWGVWKFKEGFGGQIVRHIGAWDYAPSSARYWLYTTVLPHILNLMRRRGRRQTQAALEQ